MEQSLNSTAWLAIAYFLSIAARRGGRVVASYGWRILAGLGAAQVALLQLLAVNPLWSHEPVGEWPLVNLLFLAYMVPALFAFGFARDLRDRSYAGIAGAAGIAGLVLVWTYLSLEVRRAFHGPVLSAGAMGDAELYGYSAVWLGYALVLLAIGILRRIVSLRYASLALLMATVAKVFLIDMSELTDLYRVASFFGLGLSLIGIGYLYQRYVFPSPAKGSGADSREASAG